jgi:hypothetical protein
VTQPWSSGARLREQGLEPDYWHLSGHAVSLCVWPACGRRQCRPGPGRSFAAVLCPWPLLYNGKLARGRTARSLTMEITVGL